MKKRILFIVLISILGLSSCKSKFSEIKEENKPLNVVLILTDDQGGHMSASGTQGISTPNMDWLAKEGVLFTNAFAAVPSCSPSRSSIMTGMYPHANGHWRNTITPRLSDDDKEFGRESSTVDQVGIHEYLSTLPEILQQKGYYTAITQKFHMSPPWKFPFNARNPVNNDPDEFRKVISQFVEDSGDKPFFFQANISPPHRNFDHHMDKFSQFLPDKDAIEIPGYLPDTPAMREDVQKYLGSVQLADACMGAIIDALRRKGLLENTMIIFTGDNGEPYHRAKASAYYAGLHVPFVISGPGISKNKVDDALVSLIDIMPTILDYVQISIPESVQGKTLKPLLSGEDSQKRQYVFGQHNSHGPVRSEHYPSRMVFDGRFYYIANLMHEKEYELPADLREVKLWGNTSYQATLLAKDSHPVQYNLLKQLEMGRPAEELYDMQNDPWQLNNLAESQAQNARLEEFRTVLKSWRARTGDAENDPLQIKTRQLIK